MAFVVVYGPKGCEHDAAADSLGDAARLAVRFIRDGRANVRVRLPAGEVLDFEAFQAAVFSGRLKETKLADAPRSGRPARRPEAPSAFWETISPI